MNSINHDLSGTSTPLPPLSRFVQIFDDSLVKSVHERHVAGITLVLPGGNNAEALAAVNAILDALEPALRIHTISMVLITASILCAMGMIFSSIVNRRWHNPTQRIPIYLATFDVIGCGLHLSDHIHTMLSHHPFSYDACRAVGTIYQFWTGTQVVMVTFLAINVGLCARARKSVSWGRWDLFLLVPTFVVSALLVLPGIILDSFGSSGYWCFIRADSDYGYGANILYRLVVPTIGVFGTCIGYGLATYEVRRDVHDAQEKTAEEPPINVDPKTLEQHLNTSNCIECDADSTYEPENGPTQLELYSNNISLATSIQNPSHESGYNTVRANNQQTTNSHNIQSINQPAAQSLASRKLTAWQKAYYQPQRRICRHHRHAAVHYFTAYLLLLFRNGHLSSVPLAANSFFLCSGIAHYAVYASLGRGNLLKLRINRINANVDAPASNGDMKEAKDTAHKCKTT
ncbi:hypothetical protein BDF19DRAFT_430318 [Syncephalis fuscata]|nr:hypothetical protein BDF19DRAFT_430318 [Syncephalis fuscata]